VSGGTNPGVWRTPATGPQAAAQSDRKRTWRRSATVRRLNPTRFRPPISAERNLSPAARLLIDTGSIFDIGPDHYVVDEIFPSTSGPQADVLVLHGMDDNDGDVRGSARAIQVRDLEAMIEEGLIVIAFGPNARDYNRSRGWGRNGERALTSLGIRRGSVDR
jgi:hypothetical protein